jgi:hypothetical protein
MSEARKYFVFMDESRDHGLVNLDASFPVFLLCGVITEYSEYENIKNTFNVIKDRFWKNKLVIFHSRDIRKCDKEFSVLFDLDLKKEFYDRLNHCITNCDYHIIASAIEKATYIMKYGKLSNDVYELALSFVIERTVFYLDGLGEFEKEVEIVIEKRGKKEDKKLEEHFQRLMSRGTGYVSAERLKNLRMKFIFKDKKENINGLQLADLLAYPIARYVMEPYRANPAFDILKNKFYGKGGKRYGLKVFP